MVAKPDLSCRVINLRGSGALASPTNSSTRDAVQRAGNRLLPRFWCVRRSRRQCGSGWHRAMDTARRHGRPQFLSRVGCRASSLSGQGPHHGWCYPDLRMSRARQHARRSRDTGMVAPVRGAPDVKPLCRWCFSAMPMRGLDQLRRWQ